jgi:tetratricopeptide (TPR) repeat protein/O-antigen ligase
MRSRLSILGDAVMETAWLAALMVAPLFFNIYSQRVFEPDKISLVRSLALVAFVAWLVRTVEDRQRRGEGSIGLRQRLREDPFLGPVLLLAAVYALSTALSVAPRTSLWGSYQRLQGLFSLYGYIALFLAVRAALRRPEQWERLQYVVILTSVPIALYGILQKFQLDPLPWGGDTTARVAANLGNAIFIAAYLIMVVPLTLARLIEALRRLLTAPDGTIADALTAGTLSFVLIIQLVAIVFSQSRGPWLGLAAGGYVFVLLGLTGLRQRAAVAGPLRWQEGLTGAGMGVAGLVLIGGGLAALRLWPGAVGVFVLTLAALAAAALYLVPLLTRRGWRWLWLSVIVQGVLLVVALVLINLPNTALNAAFRQIPYAGRLAQIAEVDRGTGRVRVLIWQGVVEMMQPHPPLTFPDGRTDRLNPLRPLVGYGPETMWVAFNRFYRPELGDLEARNASPDRSHNETFDSLVTTGFLGFLAYAALFAGVFFHALRWLGLIQTVRDRRLFWSLGVGGTVLGIGVPLAAGQAHYLGLGVPFGFLLGMLVYVTLAGLGEHREVDRLDRRHLLIVALLATVVAHFVEINLGIAIVSTRTYFFMFIAALSVIGTGRLLPEAVEPTPASAPAPPRATPPARKGSKRRPAAATPAKAVSPSGGSRQGAMLPYALVLALILLVLDWDFISNQTARSDIAAIFVQSWLTHLRQGVPVTGPGALWIVLFTVAVGLLLAVGTLWPSRGRLPLSVPAGMAGIGLGVWVVYGLFQARRLVPLPADWSLEAKADYVVGNFVMFLLWLTALGLALAAALARTEWATARVWSHRPLATTGLGLVGLTAALALIIAVNLNLVAADIVFKLGQSSDNRRDWRSSIVFYTKAVARQPDQDHYHLFLGRALLENARQTTDPTAQEALLRRAEQTLLRARELNPLNTDHSANLARYYATVAALSTDPAARRLALEQASTYYAQATTLSPNTAHLQNEWGTVLVQLGRYDEARARFERSLQLDPNFADTYLRRAQMETQLGNWSAALADYETATRLAPNDIRGHSGRAYALAQLGLITEAITANLAALQINPTEYTTLQNLALLYQRQGDIPQALLYARRARDIAPPEQQPLLDELIRQLEEAIGKP